MVLQVKFNAYLIIYLVLLMRVTVTLLVNLLGEAPRCKIIVFSYVLIYVPLCCIFYTLQAI